MFRSCTTLKCRRDDLLVVESRNWRNIHVHCTSRAPTLKCIWYGVVPRNAHNPEEYKQELLQSSALVHTRPGNHYHYYYCYNELAKMVPFQTTMDIEEGAVQMLCTCFFKSSF